MFQHKPTLFFLNACSILGLLPSNVTHHGWLFPKICIFSGVALRLSILPSIYYTYPKTKSHPSFANDVSYFGHASFTTLVAVFSASFTFTQANIIREVMEDFAEISNSLNLPQRFWPKSVKFVVGTYVVLFLGVVAYEFHDPGELKTDIGYFIVFVLLSTSICVTVWMKSILTAALLVLNSRITLPSAFPHNALPGLLESYNFIFDLFVKINDCFGPVILLNFAYTFFMEVGVLYQTVQSLENSDWGRCTNLLAWSCSYGFVIWIVIRTYQKAVEEVCMYHIINASKICL